MKKVSMNLTDIDISNALKIKEKFASRSNAQAVSTALALTSQLLTLLSQKNSKIYVETEDGEIQQIILPVALND